MMRLVELLQRVTPGPWSVQDTQSSWQLFGAPPTFLGEPGHERQIAKCAKSDERYAEYWPNESDSEAIILGSRVLPVLPALIDAAYDALEEGHHSENCRAYEWSGKKPPCDCGWDLAKYKLDLVLDEMMKALGEDGAGGN